MKKLTKLIVLVLAAVTLLSVSVFAISSGAVSDDPADNYEVQRAPFEDSSIDMWFDYSFRKTFMGDTESTGMDTFSIYMAKNEIESAQFVLYSEDTHSGMTATVSPFTDGKGNTVNAEIYYQFYITVENLQSQTVWGASKEDSFIREGIIPDPVAPLDNVGSFKLNAGKSQAFLIRAKTDENSVAGWYSAQLDIKNNAGQIVKTATVYLYVWDFALSDETALESAFEISNTTTYSGTYKVFYDYMLENRMCGMDLPYGLTDSGAAEYLTNDRVTSIRINTNQHTYLDMNCTVWPSIYNELKLRPYWDEIKGKFYSYTADEPLPKIIFNGSRADVDTAKYSSAYAELYWGDTLRTLVTETENHAYPYDYYDKPLTNYPQADLKDAVQELIDSDASFIWCPRMHEFTPNSLVQAYGPRQWENIDEIRGGSMYPYAGAWGIQNVCSGWDYFDWENFYGAETVDRYKSDMAYKNQNLKEDFDRELWSYCAGYNSSYSYCNHLIESTGLQTKMLFWQLYQEDVTGYLYYATNAWNNETDTTVTGAKTTCVWRTQRGVYGAGNYVYGDGVLFYGRDMGKVRGVDIIGSIRVEMMRDGIEDYQMMYQLAQLKGDEVADSFVNSVSNNVVDYISMPYFDRSAFSSSMDEYDILESVRRSLGAALEEATLETACEHQYDEGVASTPATCTRTGVKTYTCELCGATKDEIIPSLHSNGATWTKLSGTAPSCTVSGNEIFKCDLCGFEKKVKTTAYHNDYNYLEAVDKSDTAHDLVCKICGENVTVERHMFFYETKQPTCTEDGYSNLQCKNCGHIDEENVLPKIDHDYVNGVCTMCGEREFTVIYGDVNGDGKVTATDVNLLARAIVGSVTFDEGQTLAADVSGDGKITATDTNYISRYLTGTIDSFPAEN